MRKSSWLVAGVAAAAIGAGLLLAAEAPAPKPTEPAAPHLAAVANDLTWLPMSAAGVTLVIGDLSVSGV